MSAKRHDHVFGQDQPRPGERRTVIVIVILAAALFGTATPASKMLLADLTPIQLAGLLYLGAAIGVLPRAVRRGGIRLPRRAQNKKNP
jgi:drug/metabolite transporter (DMT)-like permease